MGSSVNTEAAVSCVKYFYTSQRTPEYQITMDLDVQYINKMIRTHGGKSTRQSMDHILDHLNFFIFYGLM